MICPSTATKTSARFVFYLVLSVALLMLLLTLLVIAPPSCRNERGALMFLLTQPEVVVVVIVAKKMVNKVLKRQLFKDKLVFTQVKVSGQGHGIYYFAQGFKGEN